MHVQGMLRKTGLLNIATIYSKSKTHAPVNKKSLLQKVIIFRPFKFVVM